MGTLADTIIPLMGSVSMEKAETVRKACDGLEKRLEALEHATTNTGEDPARQDEERLRKDASRATTPNNAEQQRDSVMSLGSGARPDASPAPSASEIPAWVPSADAMRQACGESAPGEYWNALRRLIASRAPRASPVSVEAVRALVDAANALHARLEGMDGDDGRTTWMLIDNYEKARSALSALPASEERPRLSDRYRLCSKCAAPDAEEISASEAPRYLDLGCPVCKPSRAVDPLVVDAHSAELSDLDNQRVRKALTDKPEQPAPASTPPIRAVAGTSLACAKCGCRWKRHADGSLQLYDADQRPCVECDNAPNAPLRPETPDDAPASTPDEGEVETPVQPIVTDKHGVTRFKANAIVAYIVDWCARKNGTVGYGPDPDGPAPDLSEISRMAFSRDDRVQLAQLIGYSLSGFEELGYVESADVHRALRLSSSRIPRVDVDDLVRRMCNAEKIDTSCFIASRVGLRDVIAKCLRAQGVECVGEKESAA